jgi:hypothetical protein
MTCHRCGGLMVNDRSVVESLSDLNAKTGRTGPSIRCINCGYLEDPVVLANRLRPPAAKPPAPARLAPVIPLIGPLQPGTERPA